MNFVSGTLMLAKKKIKNSLDFNNFNYFFNFAKIVQNCPAIVV
ncbi:Uncharacterised protein [Legionella pneumophila]|nr:hypothetical protein ULM_21410 [Legionella pneumophila]CZG22264.1 Uncharacterised protein [Legionella pneumophila]CZG58625.1 Uncharacterised protein [Legionella pneumophila]CZG82096.1 Uncharacterised protein [Legionella pneumophila]CZG83598.1 Uncharacterised protein [Legionella pneumophila]